MTGFIIVSVVLSIWLGVLSVLVFRTVRHYSQLSRGVTKAGLREVMETLLAERRDISARLKQLEATVSELELEQQYHVQKIGVLRFNPFSDTGGSQSFVLALLDQLNNGIVITSLYGRTGNRWYMKEVRSGAGKELALSKEEEKAIDMARHLRKGGS